MPLLESREGICQSPVGIPYFNSPQSVAKKNVPNVNVSCFVSSFTSCSVRVSTPFLPASAQRWEEPRKEPRQGRGKQPEGPSVSPHPLHIVQCFCSQHCSWPSLFRDDRLFPSRPRPSSPPSSPPPPPISAVCLISLSQPEKGGADQSRPEH